MDQLTCSLIWKYMHFNKYFNKYTIMLKYTEVDICAVHMDPIKVFFNMEIYAF